MCFLWWKKCDGEFKPHSDCLSSIVPFYHKRGSSCELSPWLMENIDVNLSLTKLKNARMFVPSHKMESYTFPPTSAQKLILPSFIFLSSSCWGVDGVQSADSGGYMVICKASVKQDANFHSPFLGPENSVVFHSGYWCLFLITES